MKRIIYIFLVVLLTTNLKAENIRSTLYFGYNQEAEVSLQFGVDGNLTDGYDYGIEQDVPPLPPPDGVIPVFEIYDSLNKEMKYSQIEYKRYEEDRFSKIYNIRLMGNAQVDFTLSFKGVPNGIDSILIKDKINGNIFRWLVTTPKDTVMPRFYSQFQMEVFYNRNKATSINTDEYLNSLELSELDKLIIVDSRKIYTSSDEVSIIAIFNTLGQKLNVNSENGEFNLDEVNDKVLFINIEYKKKRQTIKRIIN